jgi:cellulose synthase (UDP-forming)
MELGLGTWLLYYAGFYVMQIVLAFFTLGSFRWECLLLATVSFPIYTRALFNVITGKDTTWHVTGGKHGVASPFAFMVPQVLLFAFLLPTSVVAVWRDVNHSQLTLATIWNITNTIILGAFIGAACRELARRRRPVVEHETEPTPEPALRTVVARPVDDATPVLTRDDLVLAGTAAPQETSS